VHPVHYLGYASEFDRFDDVLIQLFDSVHVYERQTDAVMVGENCRSRCRPIFTKWYQPY